MKKEEKNLHEGHRERFRQKFIDSGFDGFNSHEIVELILFYSIPRANTNEIAHRLIEKYKSLSGICDADFNDLQNVEGISKNSAVLLKMIPLIAREYMRTDTDKIKLDNYKAVREYFRNKFIGETTEKIWIICLDNNLKLVNGTIVAEGSPGGVDINIRNIVEFTYKQKSENVIIAHNHPNGNIVPSDEDIKATANIYKALKMVGINLLDHIIVAGNQAISLKESGAFSLLK